MFDFDPEQEEEVVEEDWFARRLDDLERSSLSSVNVSWVDNPLRATSGYEWDQSASRNGSTSIPTSEYYMSDAGSSNGSEVQYVDQVHDASFEPSPASGQYQSLIMPDITSQRRNSFPSNYRAHHNLYGPETSSDDGRPEARRLSWQGGYNWNEQSSDGAPSPYHSSRRPSYENLPQLATGSMPMPYPTGSHMAYSHYNYSHPNITQSLQRWPPFNSPASSEGGIPLLNRAETPGLSAQLQSALFFHDNNDPPSHPDVVSDFGVYPSGTQVPEGHAPFNNPEAGRPCPASHSDVAEGSTASSRFIVYVPNDNAEAGPSSSPYRVLPQTDSDSDFHSLVSCQLSRISSNVKFRGEPGPKSVACNYCRMKKSKCLDGPGERCRRCTMLGIECTYSESRRGKYIRKSKKKNK